MAQKIICHCSLGRQSNRPDRRCNRRKRERERVRVESALERERERGIERARKEQRTLVEVEIQRKFVH